MEIFMTTDVLIVDDSRAICMLMRRILENADMSVLEAADGRHALSVLQRIDPPACIVTEIDLPVMDGVQLIREVRENPIHAHVPIVVLTRESDDRRIDQAKAAGASCIMSKPFDIDEFLDLITPMVESARQASAYRSAC
ncbi:response regulator [Oceanidesulfovibrio marinus]|uniref:Response regulator n=2 Tax=Oceanidesulfovibrio marinus TaxID=370038 RepID=A0A6P1ZMI4_9BACT|nr:response regulator [Oceanidesulfovibrio marinus]